MTEIEQRFTQMVARHKHTVYMVCYMFSHDKGEVDDLFQNILINLWKGFPQFEGRSDLRTWVYRVSFNTCISDHRRRKLTATVPVTTDVDLFDVTDDEEDRQIEMLHERISSLKPFDRALVLLWLENMTYDEIGDIMGLTPTNVGVRLFRIKEKLRKNGASR